MSEFAAEQKIIPHNDKDIFRVLSDLRNLELVKEMIPEDKIKDFNFDRDRVSFNVESIGKVTFLVTIREPNRLVRFKSDRLPFEIFLEINLRSKNDNETEMTMLVQSELNPFMRSVVEKPMREAVDRISDALVKLPYDKI